MPEIGKFIIHPEYLENEEIQYELTIRKEIIVGSRRELAARLRALINLEQTENRQAPLTAYSVPSHELRHCKNQIPVLKEVLEMMNPDISTQNRFMSKYLHLEGRLNRIPKRNTVHDITSGVFAANEKQSEIYNDFCARITGLRKTRVTQQADIERQSMLSQAIGGVDTSSKKISDEKNKYATGTIRKDKNSNRPSHNDFDERYRLPTWQPQPRNTNVRNNASENWFPFETFNPNLDDQNVGSQQYISLQNPQASERSNGINQTHIIELKLMIHDSARIFV